MTAEDLLKTAIIPGLSRMGLYSKPAARLLVAIALQESALRHRRQVSSDGTESGPAMSFWQFEKGGGCRGVLNHRLSAPYMRRVCEDFNVEATSQGLWTAMQYQDIVAACAARLLVLTLPKPLPETQAQGWAQYLDAWRPGTPHPDKWTSCWMVADAIVKAHG